MPPNLAELLYVQPATADLLTHLSRLPHTDVGNGDRFVLRCRDSVAYVPGIGWMVFDSKRWTAQAAEDRAFELGKAVVAGIGEETTTKDAALWCTRSQDVRRLTAMLRCARTRLLRPLDDFDSNPLALCVANGVLRFEKLSARRWQVKLDRHEARDLITRLCNSPYHPNAPAPMWRKHIARAHPDREMQWYLQTLMGYAALGLGREQSVFFFLGRGRDGKSTTVNAISRVLGDYAAAVDSALLTQLQRPRGADAPSPALVALAGDVRLAYAAEPPSNAPLDESFVKKVTGGTRLRARGLHKESFEFVPRFTPLLECNRLPRFTGTDDGIRRRLIVVPWNVQISETEVDRELDEKLAAESAGILAWIVEGALRYLEQGLQHPPAVQKASGAYRALGMNLPAAPERTLPSSFSEWLDARVERNASHMVTQKELWDSYRTHCLAVGATGMRRSAFLNALAASGLRRMQSLDSERRRVLWSGGRVIVGRCDDRPGPKKVTDVPAFSK